MSIRLFLSPYTVDEIFGVPKEVLRAQPGYWAIDLEAYKKALIQRWGKNIEFRESGLFPLSWTLMVEDAGSYMNLSDNSVSFDLYDPFEDFVLWHRSIIPEEHRLYLCAEELAASLEVKTSTSGDEIRRFADLP
jgi:hypothetical protein